MAVLRAILLSSPSTAASLNALGFDHIELRRMEQIERRSRSTRKLHSLGARIPDRVQLRGANPSGFDDFQRYRGNENRAVLQTKPRRFVERCGDALE